MVVPAEVRASELLTLGPGELHVMGQMGAPTQLWRLGRWRLGVSALHVLDPGQKRWRPLPRAVVVEDAGATWGRGCRVPRCAWTWWC